VRPSIDIIDIESGSDDETRHRCELKRDFSKREDDEAASDDSLNPKPYIYSDKKSDKQLSRSLCGSQTHILV